MDLVLECLEAVPNPGRWQIVTQVDFCPALGMGWVREVWPGPEDGQVVTAGVRLAGGQPPVTEALPSSVNDEVRYDCTFIDDSNAS